MLEGKTLGCEFYFRCRPTKQSSPSLPILDPLNAYLRMIREASGDSMPAEHFQPIHDRVLRAYGRFVASLENEDAASIWA